MNLTPVAFGLIVILTANGDATEGHTARRPPSLAPARGSASAIDPTVEVAVGYSPSLQRTRVQFIVRNGHRARLGIERFGVSHVRRPLAVHSPPQWMATYGWVDVDSIVVWSDVDTLTADVAPLQAAPSPYGVMPGDSALVFTMFLREVPSRVTCWAKGFHVIPRMEAREPPIFEWDWASDVDLDRLVMNAKKEPKGR